MVANTKKARAVFSSDQLQATSESFIEARQKCESAFKPENVSENRAKALKMTAGAARIYILGRFIIVFLSTHTVNYKSICFCLSGERSKRETSSFYHTQVSHTIQLTSPTQKIKNKLNFGSALILSTRFSLDIQYGRQFGGKLIVDLSFRILKI